MSTFNPATWSTNQFQAAGKQVASAVAGAVGLAVTWHFIAPVQATDVVGNFNDMVNGLTQFAKGAAGFISFLTLLYTSFMAAHNASPGAHVASVQAENPAALVAAVNAISPGTLVQAVNNVSPVMLRDAVAEQPDVRSVVVTTQAVANASASPKVTV